MKSQYIVQKYVMAHSVKEAMLKSRKLPIHEVFLHNGWFEKVANYQINPPANTSVGFTKKTK